jgi:hypothetical protein
MTADIDGMRIPFTINLNEVSIPAALLQAAVVIAVTILAVHPAIIVAAAVRVTDVERSGD